MFMSRTRGLLRIIQGYLFEAGYWEDILHVLKVLMLILAHYLSDRVCERDS